MHGREREGGGGERREVARKRERGRARASMTVLVKGETINADISILFNQG